MGHRPLSWRCHRSRLGAGAAGRRNQRSHVDKPTRAMHKTLNEDPLDLAKKCRMYGRKKGRTNGKTNYGRNGERPNDHPPSTRWLPMHAGKGPTTTHRRPHAVGPHVESPGQAEGRGREGRPCFSGQAASVDMGGATVHRWRGVLGPERVIAAGDRGELTTSNSRLVMGAGVGCWCW